MNSKSGNIPWLDTLRALATLGVILIHVSTPVVKMSYGTHMEFWWIGNILDSAVRFAVPLFLMLSGATLLTKEYQLGDFYKRRLLRVFVPFVFWIIVYWIYRWWVLLPATQPKSFAGILQWGIDLFLKEGVSKHFWYIYMILVLYLFVPFLGRWLRNITMKWVLNILLVWVVLAFVCRAVPVNLYSWSGNYLSKLFGYFLYSGYLVLGYYLIKLQPPTWKVRPVAAIIFIITLLVSAVGTYLLSKQSAKLDQSLYGYLSINTIIQSVAIFMWIKDVEPRNKYLSLFWNTMSNYSYGIYLSHILVIGILFNNGIFWTMAHPLVSLPCITALTLICSFGIIFVLRKIPGGKYISG